MAFDARASGSQPLSPTLGPLESGQVARMPAAAGEPAHDYDEALRKPPADTPPGNEADVKAATAKGSGTMRWRPRHLANGVGRRLLVMFVVTALAPVALMAGLSFSQVADVMREEHDTTLMRSAHVYGSAVFDRMRWADSLLAVAATSSSPAASLSARIGNELDGFVVFDRRGRLVAKGGAAPPLSQPLSLQEDVARDRQGRSALLTWQSNQGLAAGLAYTATEADQVGMIAVTLSPAFLWEAPAGEAPGTRFCATTPAGARLFCSGPMPDEALLRLTATSLPEERLAQFTTDQTAMRAGIVIAPTEALVSIDVNSGKSTHEKWVEQTAFQTNLEAAEETARQLRLRDLGGLIVIDFIDMKESKHRAEVERALKNHVKLDRARSKVGRISKFGLLEMSRQRIHPSIEFGSHVTCRCCQGKGMVPGTETLGIGFLRKLGLAVSKPDVSRVKGIVPPAVADYLLNRKRRAASCGECACNCFQSTNYFPSRPDIYNRGMPDAGCVNT